MADKTFAHKLLNNQVIRFILSVGIGFLADQLVFLFLYRYIFKTKQYLIFDFIISNYLLSFSLSFFLGVFINFIITRYFVFTESKTSTMQQFIRFMSVAVIGYFANLGLLELFIKHFHFYPPIARISAALSLFFASFFVHKFFSFSLSLRHHAIANNNTKGN